MALPIGDGHPNLVVASKGRVHWRLDLVPRLPVAVDARELVNAKSDLDSR